MPPIGRSPNGIDTRGAEGNPGLHTPSAPARRAYDFPGHRVHTPEPERDTTPEVGHACRPRQGDRAVHRLLCRSEQAPERGNSDGTTPLYLASVQGESEVARLLMEAGASPDTESRGAG
ncbi:ankyrin repeat domain-containing protein [Streptomyces chartreusis]|uniref:ankyrin repeat domain-containing protein n=1 Tax=Streptomyces chartreusis TaxID=1969 RepID=UPI0036DF2D61